MAERVRFIDHKGKQIVYLDFSDMQGDEIVQTVRKFEQLVLENKNNNNLVSLTNFTNARTFGDGLEEIKRVAKEVRPYLDKRAVVGITGVKAILYKMVNLFASGAPTKIFDTLEEAKDYLVE